MTDWLTDARGRSNFEAGEAWVEEEEANDNRVKDAPSAFTRLCFAFFLLLILMSQYLPSDARLPSFPSLPPFRRLSHIPPQAPRHPRTRPHTPEEVRP